MIEFISDLGMQYANKSSKRKRAYAMYRCHCGDEFRALKDHVKYNRITGCGCLRGNPKHGLISSPMYDTWVNMKQRCFNPLNTSYENYGGRGISVCDEWRYDFKTFHDFFIGIGWSKGLTIDRINNDGNYEPSDCRCTTRKINNRNPRATKATLEKAIKVHSMRAKGIKRKNIIRDLSLTAYVIDGISSFDTWKESYPLYLAEELL